MFIIKVWQRNFIKIAGSDQVTPYSFQISLICLFLKGVFINLLTMFLWESQSDTAKYDNTVCAYQISSSYIVYIYLHNILAISVKEDYKTLCQLKYIL